jgi:hypothetical protein
VHAVARVRLALLIAPWLACVFGCGGRTGLGADLDLGAARDAGADVLQTLVLDGGTPCRTRSGVRICGGSARCPWLTAPDCPGRGCEETGPDSGTGVCFSDLSDLGDRLCTACNDGEVCAFRGAADLVCVPQDLCATLWNAGGTSACRYADKSAYTNLVLPVPSGACPGNLGASPGLSAIICGGPCGACSPGAPCAGRSPGRPFGVCAEYNFDGMPTEGSCAGAALPGSCGIFEVAPADQPEADKYGFIIMADCPEIATSLPGGFRCE